MRRYPYNSQSDADRFLWNSLETGLSRYIQIQPITSERTRISSRNRGEGKLIQISLPESTCLMEPGYQLSEKLTKTYLRDIVIPTSSEQFINAIEDGSVPIAELFLVKREKRDVPFYEITSFASRKDNLEQIFREQLFSQISLASSLSNRIFSDCIEPFMYSPDQYRLFPDNL